VQAKVTSTASAVLRDRSPVEGVIDGTGLGGDDLLGAETGGGAVELLETDLREARSSRSSHLALSGYL